MLDPADQTDERAFCAKEAADPERVSQPVPAGKELGKTTVSWDTTDGSINVMFQWMGEEFCLLTRVEEPQLPIGLKRVRPTNFASTTQITASSWQVLLLEEQVVSDIALVTSAVAATGASVQGS
jgi:hypothetical protein